LTRQLLLFSRKQPMETSVVDINNVLRGMLDMLTRLMGEDIYVRASFDQDVWAIPGERAKIEQAIVNLVVNARDAMAEGGQIAITTENVTLDEQQCALIPNASPGRYVCLSVTDEGCGMDETTLQRIFEPFFTTKDTGRGIGLGLSVVHGIVNRHGGWVNAYSEPGKGSAFKVFFSAVTAPASDHSATKLLLQRYRGNGERILVVEDDEAVRQLLVRILTESGYSVAEAAGRLEALRIFAAEDRLFDLVLSDVLLSDGDGVGLIDEILSLAPEIGVLLSSGYTDDRSRWQVICERGLHFLQKPFTMISLLEAVHSVLAGPATCAGSMADRGSRYEKKGTGGNKGARA
jgi:CheY-like chemotaxis protein